MTEMTNFVESALKRADIVVFPAVGAKLFGLMNKPLDPKELVSVIEQDVGLVAVVLRHVNAASSPVVREVLDVKQATMLLGVHRVFAVACTEVISTQIRSIAVSVKTTSFLEVWRRALLTAKISDHLRQLKGGENVYINALLYHLGMVLLLETYSDKYLALIRATECDLHAQITLERQVFGISFEDAGHYVMKAWKFPRSIIEILTPNTSNQTKDTIESAAVIANLFLRFDYGYITGAEIVQGHGLWVLEALSSPEMNGIDPAFDGWVKQIVEKLLIDFKSVP